MSVESNLQLIYQKIETAARKSSRNPKDIKLIAVSKTRSVEEVRDAIALGLNIFGESTIQDAKTKIPFVGKNEWHFIGHLQSKKAKDIPGNFDWIHTIDSIKLAQKISQAALQHNPSLNINCLVQVNVSGEASKSGIPPNDVIKLVGELQALALPNIHLRGLMTMGVKDDDAKTRQVFSALRDNLKLCAKQLSIPEFDQLSMGMSDDFQIAIEEGSTMIRIGSSIFGERL